jgi:hypothetical protein
MRRSFIRGIDINEQGATPYLCRNWHSRYSCPIRSMMSASPALNYPMMETTVMLFGYNLPREKQK